MNKEQALAMLKFIAELYLIIQAPAPEPAPAPQPFADEFMPSVNANAS